MIQAVSEVESKVMQILQDTLGKLQGITTIDETRSNLRLDLTQLLESFVRTGDITDNYMINCLTANQEVQKHELKVRVATSLFDKMFILGPSGVE